MSSANPYQPSGEVASDDFGIRKVSVRPIQLLQRGYAALGDQYWLFLGITLVGILVGSAVPMGIIMGPMMVGIYLCYMQREQGQRTEFGTLFRGFDYFVESLVAYLMLMAVTLLVMVPFMIAVFAMIAAPAITAANAGNAAPPPPSPQFLIAIFGLYLLSILAMIAITLPFLFTFQLIADRNLKAVAAVKTSARGVLKNFGGILWYMFVLMFVSLILTMMCFIPAILFMPISFGAFFVLYRDIFGPATGNAPLEQV